MTESSSFSSLLELVDSHLSKTSIQGNRSEDSDVRVNHIPVSSMNGSQPSIFSDIRLTYPTGQGLPIPSFYLNQSPIQNVLAEQVVNMLKAKELKKQQEEEKKKLEEEKSKLEEEDGYVIDLMQALQMSCEPRALVKQELLCNSSSFESPFEANVADCEKIQEQSKSPEPLLPCITDMSYILTKKIKRGKGSAFGKVISSRLKPVAVPYCIHQMDTIYSTILVNNTLKKD